MYENCINKINCYDYDVKKHDKILLQKTINALKDKYRNLIRERNFNMNCFKQKVMKEIKKLTYYFIPNYDSFYIKMERLFLKEISNCYNLENNGLLTPPSVHNMLYIQNYKYSVHFPVGKVTLRNVVENEPELAPVDKYLKVKDRIRALSSNQRRINYSNNIINNLPRTNYYY